MLAQQASTKWVCWQIISGRGPTLKDLKIVYPIPGARVAVNESIVDNGSYIWILA